MRKVIDISEHEHQKLFVNWIRLNYKQYIIAAIPNGGKRNIFEAKKLKDEGVLGGMCDLMILMPNKEIVFLEMKKSKGGVLSKNQKELIPKIEKLGFTVLIGYGFLDAKEKFENYLLQKVTSD
jgi:VRR-NUC domain.